MKLFRDHKNVSMERRLKKRDLFSQVKPEGQFYILFMKLILQREHEYVLQIITTHNTKKQISR